MLVLPALLAARPAGTLRTARVQMVDYTGRTESEWREALTPQEFEVLREESRLRCVKHSHPDWFNELAKQQQDSVDQSKNKIMVGDIEPAEEAELIELAEKKRAERVLNEEFKKRPGGSGGAGEKAATVEGKDARLEKGLKRALVPPALSSQGVYRSGSEEKKLKAIKPRISNKPILLWLLELVAGAYCLDGILLFAIEFQRAFLITNNACLPKQNISSA